MPFSPGIGGQDASRPDIGSVLAQGMGGGMGGPPPQGDPMSGGMGAGPQQPDPALLEAVNHVRSIGDLVAQLQASHPIIAEDANQISQILKQAVIKIAQAQTMQTTSGMAVPGGGPGMGMG